MRETFGLILLSLFAATTAMAQAAPKPGTEGYFRYLTERRAAASVAEDRGFYEKLLSKNFVIVGDNGEITDRADYLEAEFGTKRPKGMQPVYAFADFRLITASQNFAVVSYIKTEGMKMGGQAFTASARRLDTYALESGEWHLVAMAAVAIVKPPNAIKVSPEKLAEYAGTYTISPQLKSVVTVAGDHLAEQTTGHSASILRPVGPDTFFDPADSPIARTIFRRDDRGKVIAEVYTSGDQEVVGTRSP